MDYLQGLKLRKDKLYEKLEEYENRPEDLDHSIIRVKAQIMILDELINELEVEE